MMMLPDRTVPPPTDIRRLWSCATLTLPAISFRECRHDILRDPFPHTVPTISWRLTGAFPLVIHELNFRRHRLSNSNSMANRSGVFVINSAHIQSASLTDNSNSATSTIFAHQLSSDEHLLRHCVHGCCEFTQKRLPALTLDGALYRRSIKFEVFAVFAVSTSAHCCTPYNASKKSNMLSG